MINKGLRFSYTVRYYYSPFSFTHTKSRNRIKFSEMIRNTQFHKIKILCSIHNVNGSDTWSGS